MHNMCGEVIAEQVSSYEQARNQAQKILGDMGYDSKPYVGRLDTSSGYGQIIGRQTADGKARWRLDFDTSMGPHINIEDFRFGKGDSALKIVIPFIGDEETVISYLKHLNR